MLDGIHSPDPEELFEDDLNGLDDESDELPRLAWVAEILKHPIVKPSAMMTIKLDAIRAIVVYLPSMVFFAFTADRVDRPGFG